MQLRFSQPRAQEVSAPSFARDGEFATLRAPFRAPITILSAGPGAVRLSTTVTVERGFPLVPVHWEVARDASFRRPERYGLLLARQEDSFAVSISLDGLERGRSYWARFWTGGAWSRVVRVRTGPRANGSSALAVTLIRRLRAKAS